MNQPTDQKHLRIGDIVDSNAIHLPDRIALASHEFGISKSFSEFRNICDKAARGLMALGVERGDHIAIWADNLPQWLYTQFGAARIGAVLVTVNTNFRSFELEYLLEQSNITTMIIGNGLRRENAYIEILHKICPEIENYPPGKLESGRFPRLKNIIHLGDQEIPGLYSWDTILDRGKKISDSELAERSASLNADDVIMLQYTSGTTGYPKGVMLTHANLIENARSMAEIMALSPEDTLCIPVPLFHCFGCVTGAMCCTISGATMAPVTTFKADIVMQTVEALKCTAIHGVPAMFRAELEEMEKNHYDTSHLRTGVIAGSTCPLEILEGVIEKMGAKEMTTAYGQTESTLGITQTRRNDSLKIKTETVGRALPGVEIKIVNTATGESLPPGETGELCTRSSRVMQGYYNMPNKTAETIDRDGWLFTGDLASMDEYGNCTIQGRLKDMIICGGENIYPREVEKFLHTHPQVKEVQVVGIPSRVYGEEIAAFIRLKNADHITKTDIAEFCRERISNFKIPRNIYFVDEFPATASGKIQKFKLRRWAMKDAD